MRLAEIFLMKPLQGGSASRILAVGPVIALHQQILDAVDASGLHLCGGQAGRGRQLHAERFVENDALEAFHRGFQDVRARRASEWQGNLIALDAHGDFVLRAGQRKADPFLARQQRALWQFLQYRGEFLRRERPVAVVALRQASRPAGMKVTAPAHSPPICSSMA